MWVLIFSSALLIFIIYNLHVSGSKSCGNNVFLHNPAEDNLLFDSGLLLETNALHRIECVSLSHLQDGCNLILYSPSTGLCRLHNYLHANQTGTGVTATGWTNYARQCTEQQIEPDCDVSDTSAVDSCQSCFYDNVWKVNDVCIEFETHFTNTGGASFYLVLNFDLEDGMVVIVKGSVHDDVTKVGICLEDTDDVNTHLGVNLVLGENDCESYCESSSDVCDGVMSQVDPSGVTFTFRLKNNTTEIFVEGTYLIQYPNLVRRNRMDIHGFGDVDHVQIIHTPDSCN